MSEKSIKVTLAGRIYPITVKAEEEDNVRAAAGRVEGSIKEMQESFAVKDKQDLLAMTALKMTVGLMDAERAQKGGVESDDLNRIEGLIEDMLAR